MRSGATKPKPVWANRFAMPTISELRSGMPSEAAVVFDHARQCLGEIPGVVECVKWMGVPWSWSLVYAQAGEPDGWAFLIPEPGRLQIALSLPADRLGEIQVKKLPRFVREGLLQTQVVGRACWPTWAVQSTAQVDDIVRLAQSVRASMSEGVAVS